MKTIIRPAREQDKDILYDWILNKDLVNLSSSYKPVSERAHAEWFSSMCSTAQNSFFFVIEDTLSRRVIGSCQLVNINWISRNAEFRIRIGDSSFWGKGHGTEATQLLVQFGFFDLQLHRIYLTVFSTNTRAIEMYKKCDFKHEGQMKDAVFIDGQFIDVVIMGRVNNFEK